MEQESSVPQTGVRVWIAGARLHSLPLSLSSIVVGCAVAGHLTNPATVRFWVLALLCLLVAFFLQVGVNYANDYSDGIRGTDSHRARRGGKAPFRITASGAVPAKKVLVAALVCFGIACAAGLAIAIIIAQYWLIALGAVCVAAAWFYTGGKHPYGYAGLGELSVFIFFGLVATLGTQYVLADRVDTIGILGACLCGVLSCGMLMVNNYRDIPEDTAAGKRTLAVRLGEKCSLIFVAGLYVVATLAFAAGSVLMISPNTWFLALFALLPVWGGFITYSRLKNNQFGPALAASSKWSLIASCGYALVALLG